MMHIAVFCEILTLEDTITEVIIYYLILPQLVVDFCISMGPLSLPIPHFTHALFKCGIFRQFSLLQ